MSAAAHRETIGVLYPGEMGSALAKLLANAGVAVLATTENRSARTRELCREAGVPIVATLGEVLERSDILLSLVAPSAALSIAVEVAGRVRASERRRLYVDANSIAPATVAEIAEVVAAAGMDFADASIFGLASQLLERGRLFVSGARAAEIAKLFETFLRVRVVGEIPGQASALKMIVAGLPKGMCALFLETMLLAREMDLLDESLDVCGELYPAVMEVMRRMLPTYPTHAARRADELAEIERTMRLHGVEPAMIPAARAITAEMAGIEWRKDPAASCWSVTDIITRLRQAESQPEKDPESVPASTRR